MPVIPSNDGSLENSWCDSCLYLNMPGPLFPPPEQGPDGPLSIAHHSSLLIIIPGRADQLYTGIWASLAER